LNRDIVKHVTADIREDLPKAEAIFDWVIRNVQLVPISQLPAHRVIPRLTLILGLGSELDRTWTFMELVRQAGIESVLLGYQDKDPVTNKILYVPLLPAVMVENSLYLFDTTLGLAVPGPDGKGIATLRQVSEDPSLLTALDLDS